MSLIYVNPYSFVATDPNFADVSLLLHGNGTNGSTTITDNSPSPKTVTAVGNAQISTAQSKFGGASMLFDGTGDFLRLPLNNSDFYFGSGNFTVEGWVYLNSTAGSQVFAHGQSDYANAANASWSFYVTGAGASALFYGASFVTFNPPGVSANTWTHVAWVRDGSTVTVYRDGQSQETVNLGTATINNGTTNNTCIGATNTGLNAINGYIDDLRITKGVARYTANFTPPTAPFPND